MLVVYVYQLLFTPIAWARGLAQRSAAAARAKSDT